MANLGWKSKAIIFKALEIVPYGIKIHRMRNSKAAQGDRILSPTTHSARWMIRNFDTIKSYFGDVSEKTVLEIGAGWDLYSNLVLYCLGINKQFAVDLNPWLRPASVNAAIRHLRSDPPPGAIRVPEVDIRSDNALADLSAAYGIIYRAPFNMGDSGFEDASIDAIISTSVLEHVKKESLGYILSECFRVMIDDGVMAHVIDFSDHYAHADKSITWFNFLKFSPFTWSLFDNAVVSQNRMRGPDYQKIFLDHGFSIIEREPWLGKSEELAKVRVDSCFDHLSRSELLEIGNYFVLAKNSSAKP